MGPGGHCSGPYGIQRHRHVEFIRFLNTVEREVDADKSIHVVLDNYATHKTPLIRNWLAKRPRWHVHLTPTSAEHWRPWASPSIN